MLASKLADTALVIGALGGFVTVTTTAVLAVLTFRRAGVIQHEVKTMNELTIGQLGEAAESRRIHDIPAADRTPREARHVVDDILRDHDH